jgi:lysine 2,3-aminomutase
MVGPANAESLSPTQLEAALDYIRERPQIWEVILTGGDPLILSPRRVREVTAALGSIAHVKVLRWHSRVPIVTPDRVTDELVHALTSTDASVVVGIHANHARELTRAARDALKRMARAGILLVSQTVLLKGVNDDVGTLEALMRGFVEAGIKPYYLHHPDRAPGTARFSVGIERGQELMAGLRRRLSGVAMPTYVLDIPGARGKVPIEPGRTSKLDGDEGWLIVDPMGARHVYNDVLE